MCARSKETMPAFFPICIRTGVKSLLSHQQLHHPNALPYRQCTLFTLHHHFFHRNHGFSHFFPQNLIHCHSHNLAPWPEWIPKLAISWWRDGLYTSIEGASEHRLQSMTTNLRALQGATPVLDHPRCIHMGEQRSRQRLGDEEWLVKWLNRGIIDHLLSRWLRRNQWKERSGYMYV